MQSFRQKTMQLRIWLSTLVLSFFVICLSSLTVSAQEKLGATLYNSTSQTVDYYVVLSDGQSTEYVGTIAPGLSANDNFFPGEIILIYPQNGNAIQQEFRFDGTPNAVLTVSAPSLNLPPKLAGVPASAVDVPPPSIQVLGPPQPPKVIMSEAFKNWLKTDSLNHEPRELNLNTYAGSHQDKFRTDEVVRRGYNLLKMDPSDLVDRGLNSNAPLLTARLKDEDRQWGIRERGFAMPNDLVLISEKAKTTGQEVTSVMFSSEQERKSTSTNVGLGGGAKGTSAKGGKDAASIKVGVTRSKTNFESSGDTFVRKEIVGQAYWLGYAKEHIRLSQQFQSAISKERQPKTYADFEEFFEIYGTHWPVATLLGGYARYEQTVKTEAMGEQMSKSLSIEGSATVPIKAAEVTPSIGFSTSNETSSIAKESLGKSKFTTAGGNNGANFSMWSMQPITSAAEYVPLKVELRGIHELMWPELMGVTDQGEANRIHALRVKTAEMLDRYIEKAPVDNSEWNPRIYKATYDHVKINKDDDEGNDTKMEFYGTGSIIPSGGKKVEVTGVRHRGGDTPSRKKGDNLMSGSKKAAFLTRPATAYTTTENGRQVTKAKFETDGHFKFETRYREYDPSSDDEKAHGDIKIYIKDVEEHARKKITRTKSFSEDGEGIEVRVTVERANYTMENEPLELLPLPKLTRFGEGDAIARRNVNGSGGSGYSAIPDETGFGRAKFKRTENSAISGHNDRKLSDVSVDECKSACLNETSFTCLSFDYHKKTNKCDLSKASAQTGAVKLFSGTLYDHYARLTPHKPSSTGTTSNSSGLNSGIGTCLVAATTSNGANVTSGKCDASNSGQSWTVKGKSIVHGSGKCLDVRARDKNVILWSCHGGPNQQWVKSGQAFKNVKHNMCLDIAGSGKKDGTNVLAYKCTGNKNQIWN